MPAFAPVERPLPPLLLEEELEDDEGAEDVGAAVAEEFDAGISKSEDVTLKQGAAVLKSDAATNVYVLISLFPPFTDPKICVIQGNGVLTISAQAKKD